MHSVASAVALILKQSSVIGSCTHHWPDSAPERAVSQMLWSKSCLIFQLLFPVADVACIETRYCSALDPAVGADSWGLRRGKVGISLIRQKASANVGQIISAGFLNIRIHNNDEPKLAFFYLNKRALMEEEDERRFRVYREIGCMGAHPIWAGDG